MNKPIPFEDISEEEFYLDFSETLEHPLKINRYLQYRYIDEGIYQVREIEINTVNYCETISILLNKTVDSSELSELEYHYNTSNYDPDSLPPSS